MNAARGSPHQIERAVAPLVRDDETGAVGDDDLAAPGWDAFLRSRRRCLRVDPEHRAHRAGEVFSVTGR